MARGSLYDKKSLAGFAGVNLAQEPDAIKDEQASDILNFRHTHTGYIESRNGVRALEILIDADPDYLSGKFVGATALSEFVLKTAVGSAEGMLFAPGITSAGLRAVLRLTNNNSPYAITSHDRYLGAGLRLSDQINLAYVFVPLTQIPESRVDWDHTWMVRTNSGTLPPDPPSATATTAIWFIEAEKPDGEATDIRLIQPPRQMERAVDVNGDDALWVDPTTGAMNHEVFGWIDEYQQMTQFQDALVIADRINGDMALHDEYDEAEPNDTPAHRLRLSQNCKAEFDVDIINIDYQLGTGEKNDLAGSVEHGMALYKFYLPKSRGYGYVDHYHDNMVNYLGKDVEPHRFDWSSGGDDFYNYEYEQKLNPLMNNSGCFLRGFTAWAHVETATSDNSEHLDLGGVLKCLKSDRQRKYIYSNFVQDTEYDDLLRRASLTNPDIPKTYDADGHVINQSASDVFIWEDHRINYKVSSGTTHGLHLLRGIDRKFGKTIPIEPKTVTLKNHLNLEQRVQLGVWGAIGVWDFGNGDYSAPSAVFQYGDLLWSALTDDELQIAKNSTGDYTGTRYKRESYYEGDGTENSYGGVTFSDFPIPSASSVYTDLFLGIKEKLYSSNMKLGPGGASDKDKATLISLYHPKDEIRLNGVALEGIGVSIIISDPAADVDATIKSTYELVALSQLVVPLTKISTKNITLNSIFADVEDAAPYGLYRKAMGGGIVDYELVFPEYNTPVGHPLGVHDSSLTVILREDSTVADSSLLPNAHGYAVTALCTSSDKLVWGENFDTSEEIDVAHLDTNGYFGRDIDTIRYKYDIQFNLVRDFASDTNNTATSSASSVLRLTSRQDQRFLNTNFDTPVEVIDRIMCQGIAELVLADYGSVGACRTEKFADPNTANDAEAADPSNTKCINGEIERMWITDTNGTVLRSVTNIVDDEDRAASKGHMILIDEYTMSRVMVYDRGGIPGTDDSVFIGQRYIKLVGHPNDPDLDTASVKDPHTEDNTFSNLKVLTYLPGERLMIPEQLSAYFPSSILFNAPRVRISIASDNIPRRAKRLLLFRTVASHSNVWQPDAFGLVKTIDVKRDSLGVPDDITFFDDVKDQDIDFSTTPSEFEGITKPLRSRFAVQWAKKMVYMNYIEHYQPRAPRGFIQQATVTTPIPDMIPNHPVETDAWNVSWETYTNPADTNIGTLLFGDHVRYFIVFRDALNIASELKLSPDIDLTAIMQATAIFIKMAGYPYTGAIDKCEVYRCIGTPHPTTNRYKKIGEIKPEDEGVFVDYGKEAGTDEWLRYNDISGLPESVERVDINESGIALSLANNPSWITGTDREFLRIGDGDQITGGDVIYGDLVVFKENSVHRITPRDIQGTIGRIEEVANQWGCIAPNTVIAHNSEVYFLSWNGLMKYNNNVFQQLDGDFGYELGLRLKDEYRGIINPGIRDASLALNPIYGELYLNIPVYNGPAAYDYHQAGLKGHVYVINLGSGFVTKFGYETADREIFYPGQEENPKTLGTWERSLAKIYHKSTLGQLFSADVLPKQVGLRSLLYIEAPTNNYYDELQPAIKADGTPEDTDQIITVPVHSWWRSKLFYEYSKTTMKKIRNAFAYFSRAAKPRMGVEFMNNEYQPPSITEAQFSTVGELQFVPPRRSAGHDRGERMFFHVAAEGDAEVQAFEFHWREVNKFAR